MKNDITTIEDLLELIAGLRRNTNLKLNQNDATIMQSIARQSFRGTALTDRQHALMQSKLLDYRNQFIENGYDFDSAIDNLRQPLREIDRSKYIKIVTQQEMFKDTPYEAYKQNWKWIKVRFPFSKKDISKLQIIVNKARMDKSYHHEKGSHEHFFLLKENNLYNLVNLFSNSSFVISQEVLDIYKEIKTFNDNRDSYIPGVYNYNLCNISENANNALNSELGKPDEDNLLLYKDRSLMYGLRHFDEDALNKSSKKFSDLSVRIANRVKGCVLVDSSSRNLQSVLDSFFELERFPLLIVCDEDQAESQLVNTYEILRNRLMSQEISVMFRLDGETDFNHYVKDKQLNNYVDKNTKVVYTSKSKISKPLLKADWNFKSVLLLSSYRTSSKFESWLEGTDLVLIHDERESNFSFLRTPYYSMDKIV